MPMRSESSRPTAHVVADRILGALLQSGDPGIVVSIDIGGSFFDFVARNAAESARHLFVAAPSLLCHRSRLNDRGIMPIASDIVAEPFLFGRIDGMTRIDREGEVAAGYAPRVQEFSTQSIDSWRATRRPLRHIHFGDPWLMQDQLAGATNTLATDRPTLTFYTKSQNRNLLLSRLTQDGYRILDLSGSPVQGAASSADIDFGWLAVPVEKYADDLDRLDPDAGKGFERDVFSQWQQALDHSAMPRQRRSGDVLGLPAVRLARTIPASEIVVERESYPVESDGTNSWRWIGPRPRTRLAVPCAFPGIYQAEIAIIASRLLGGLAACRIIVDGREVQTEIHGVEEGRIRFIAQMEARNYAGYLNVDLVSLGAVAPAENDPRTLRLNIQSIAISPWR
ncbi:MAG TPA: hypothetical protein VII49_14250 [Rhizomicrobium sp.]